MLTPLFSLKALGIQRVELVNVSHGGCGSGMSGGILQPGFCGLGNLIKA